MRRLPSCTLAVGLLTLALLGAVLAQAPASALPAFDVVSVKPFRTAGPWHRAARFDPQRLYIGGMSPWELIKLAYSVNLNQIAGLPRWALFNKDHLYQITGVTGQPTSQAQMLLMLRRVLAERFQLVVSESTKVQPVYFLEVARGGPKLVPIKPGDDCQKRVDSLPLPPGDSVVFARVCTIPALVAQLNSSVNMLPMPLIDKTGLTGNYAMVLGARFIGVTPRLRREPIAAILGRELGLSMVKGNAPYRVLNVVHIAPPGRNR